MRNLGVGRGLFVLLVGGLLMAGAAGAAVPPAAAPAPAGVEATSSLSALSTAVDPAFPHAFTERTLGSPTAPVTITAYSSLTCSHCADFYLGTFPDLKKNYVDTGKVRFVFKEFVFNLTGLHAAMAAHCVDPKSFFDLTLTLFRTQNTWALNSNGEGVLRQMAGFAGLSPDRYAACTSSKPLEDYFVAARAKATKELGINSTPTFLFSGGLDRIVGAQDYKAFSAVIERRLAKAAATSAPPSSSPSPPARKP